MSFDYSPSCLTAFQGKEGLDHRKRRRNRLRASCLNCYASKRKCDKRRPCTRCVRLGTTSLCVYEIEDPAIIEQDHLNEIRVLKQHVENLESIILDLRSKLSCHGHLPDSATSTHTSITPYMNCYEEVQKPLQTCVGFLPQSTITAARACTAETTQEFAYPSEEDRPSSSGTYSSSPLSYEDRGSPASAQNSTNPDAFAISDENQPCPSPAAYIPQDYNTTCDCSRIPSAFASLLKLKMALKSSKENLEYLHERNYDCILLARIASLETRLRTTLPDRSLEEERASNSSDLTNGLSNLCTQMVPQYQTVFSSSHHFSSKSSPANLLVPGNMPPHISSYKWT